MQTITVCAILALFLGCATATPFSPQSRIVGGKDAASDAAPFIVSLQWVTTERRQHFCAAAIIDEDWILTAAHCVQALPIDSTIKVTAGKTNLAAEDTEDVQVRYVNRYIVHENFTGGISSDDLALLRIDEPFVFTDAVQPVALPRTKEVPSGSVTIYGWGSTSLDFMPEYPDTLQKATTEILDYQDCEQVLGGEGASALKSSNLCTGPLEGGVSTCNGDSGGPLVKTDAIDGHQTLVGIVSWGFYPCGGRNTPSIYVRVAAYTAWIEQMRQ